MRFEVFKRDSFTCQYCGNKAPQVVLEVDHIEPVSKGGTNEILNLVTSCFDCNRGKSNRELSDEIKKEQSNKKDISIVEGIKISSVDEVMNYYRHLTNGELRLLTLQRVINRNPVADGMPIEFWPFIQQIHSSKRKDVIEDCKRTLTSALFNKNASQEFWELFAEIYSLIVNHPADNVQELFNKLDKELIEEHPNFEILSTKYFISVIREGII